MKRVLIPILLLLCVPGCSKPDPYPAEADAALDAWAKVQADRGQPDIAADAQANDIATARVATDKLDRCPTADKHRQSILKISMAQMSLDSGPHLGEDYGAYLDRIKSDMDGARKAVDDERK